MKRKSHNAYGASNELKFQVRVTIVFAVAMVTMFVSALVFSLLNS